MKKVINKVDIITLREKSSRQELQGIIDPNIPVFVTADPVFALENGDEKTVMDAISRSGIPDGKDFFVIAVREWKKNDENLQKKIAAFAERIYEKYGLVPMIVAMQDVFDKGISKEIANIIKVPCGVLETGLSPKVVLGVVGKAKLVLGMRLHTLIYAAKNCVPAIALDYDPKVNAVVETLGHSFVMKVENIDVEKLVSFVDDIMENYDRLQQELCEKSGQYKALADKNTEMAIDLLR